MHKSNNQDQVGPGRPARVGTLRDSRCALALLLILGLASVSVVAATNVLSQAHAHRLATDLRL